MSKSRKDLVREYKERKPRRGVFAVRCAPTGQVWVSATPTLDTQQNQTWFGLKAGGHPNRELQQAWKQHGESAFSYEILDELPDSDADVTAYAVKADLKELETRWREKLSAPAVTG